MIFFYRFFYFIAKQIFCFLTLFIRNEKLLLWKKLKAQSTTELLKIIAEKNLIGAYWFHASSGELEYCKSVIRELKARAPNEKVVVSFSSPSALKLFSQMEGLIDHHFALPWDQMRFITPLFKNLQPKALIFSKTDYWPVLIAMAVKHHIPLMALAVDEPTSNCPKKLFLKFNLSPFKKIWTVDQATTENLKSFLPQVEIETTSDPRFDQAFHRLSLEPKINISGNLPEGLHKNSLIVFGSTWPEDDQVLAKAAPELLKNNFKLIWCPHEFKKMDLSVFESLKDSYKIKRLSELHDKPSSPAIPIVVSINDFDILLVDKVGYLADIYRFSSVSFIGGSFKKKIHSVMEALAADNIVFYGPYFANNPEARETYQKGLSFCVHNEQDILSLVRKLQEGLNPNTTRTTETSTETLTEPLVVLKERLTHYTELQKGSSKHIATQLDSLLNSR